MEWYSNTLPMREQWDMHTEEYLHIADSYFLQGEEENFGEDWLNCYAIWKILDAKYKQIDIDEVICKHNYLNIDQKIDLRELFSKYEKLFTGKLGLYPHKSTHRSRT